MCAESVMQVSAEALQEFEAALPYAKMVMMYQDVIPLVNAAACEKIMAEVGWSKIYPKSMWKKIQQPCRKINDHSDKITPIMA